MNLERAAMKGNLAEAKEKKTAAVARAEALSGQIRQHLNTALVAVEDQEIATVDLLVDDLLAAHLDIAELNGRINRLTRELGD